MFLGNGRIEVHLDIKTFLLAGVGIEPRVLDVLAKHSTSELYAPALGITALICIALSDQACEPMYVVLFGPVR